MKKRFDSVDRAFDQLVGTRRRQLERPLLQLEALRLQRGLPLDGQLFAADADDGASDDDDTETPPGGTLRRSAREHRESAPLGDVRVRRPD